MSAGSGLAKRSRLPVTGCTKASTAACSACRPSASSAACASSAEIARARLEAGAVGHVAEQGMADVGEVHADLVRAARLERELEQAGDAACVRPPP